MTTRGPAEANAAPVSAPSRGGTRPEPQLRGASLTIDGVTQRFGGVTALDAVSVTVPAGTICGLIGPTGAGKTTLLNVASGLVPPTGGRILLGDRDVTGRPPHVVAALGMARTFQNIRLFTDLSVLENVMLGRHLRRRATLVEALLRLPRARHEEAESRAAAAALLERLGMTRLAQVEAGTLSYGDQRRVEIARALALEPHILLLDEPAAGLNSSETAVLADVLLDLRATGLTLLVIEHDMELIMRVSDRVVVLNFGAKIAEGPPATIRVDPRVIQAYLGDDQDGA